MSFSMMCPIYGLERVEDRVVGERGEDGRATRPPIMSLIRVSSLHIAHRVSWLQCDPATESLNPQ